MKRLHELAHDYESAFDIIKDKLAEMRRETSAGVMSQLSLIHI